MQFDIRLFGFQLVNFFLFWLILHFAISRILNGIRRRNQQIALDLESARKERELADQMRQAWDEKMKQVAAEERKIITAAHIRIKELQFQELDKTRDQIKELTQQAQIDIGHFRHEAVRSLRHELVEFAAELSVRFMGDEIDRAKAERIIDGFIVRQEKPH